MKQAILAALLAFLAPLWVSAQRSDGNGIDRGGGGEGALEFRAAGTEVVEYLARWAAQGTLEPELAAVDIDALRGAVESTVISPSSPLRLTVDLCHYHPDLAADQSATCREGQRRPHRMEVTAIGRRRRHTIALDEGRWAAWGRESTRLAIALHEYRFMLGADDLLYLESQAFLRHYERERDAEAFRAELRRRLTALAASQRAILTPDLSHLATMVAVVRATPEHQMCMEAPQGSDLQSVVVRTDACRRLAHVLSEIRQRPEGGASHAEAFVHAEEVRRSFLSWVGGLAPRAQRDYALRLEDMLLERQNAVAARITAAVHALIAGFNAGCPGTTTDAAICALRRVEEFADTTGPATIESGLIDFDADALTIEAFAADYIAR